MRESIQSERQICFAISLTLTFCPDSIDSDRNWKDVLIVQLGWVKGDLLIVLPRFLPTGSVNVHVCVTIESSEDGNDLGTYMYTKDRENLVWSTFTCKDTFKMPVATS